MEAFNILPVADLAAIFQNGRYLPLASLNMYHNLSFLWMLEVISVLDVISIVQLHILVCLPNIDDSHFDKMATILQARKMNFTLQRLW